MNELPHTLLSRRHHHLAPHTLLYLCRGFPLRQAAIGWPRGDGEGTRRGFHHEGGGWVERRQGWLWDAISGPSVPAGSHIGNDAISDVEEATHSCPTTCFCFVTHPPCSFCTPLPAVHKGEDITCWTDTSFNCRLILSCQHK